MNYFVPLMWVCFGIWFIVGVKKVDNTKQRYVLLGITYIIFGMIGFVGTLLQNEKMSLFGGTVPIIVLLIAVPIMIKRRTKNCNTVVTASCINYNEYYGIKGQRMYAAVFMYTYYGREYQIQSPLSYSKRKIAKKIKVGEKYQIYIDENNPDTCIESKKVPLGYLLMGAIGWIWTGVMVWYTFFL